MKKVFLGTTALVLSAGVAFADAHTGVSISGDARMGIKDAFATQTNLGTTLDPDFQIVDSDVGFSSRVRIEFGFSGQTDLGMLYGGSIRADNASDGASGNAGEVYIGGSWGQISMGDVDGGAKAAVGQVDGIGYTDLNDFQEIIYVANVGPTPGVLYSNSFGDAGFYLSAGNPENDVDAFAVGASYTFGALTGSIGYEDTDAATVSDPFDRDGVDIATDVPVTHMVAGLKGTFGGLTLKGVYGDGEAADTVDISQYAVSGTYGFGATDVTAYVRQSSVGETDFDAYGIGASYDLGGGATLAGGWANLEADGPDGAVDGDTYDFGIKFSF